MTARTATKAPDSKPPARRSPLGVRLPLAGYLRLTVDRFGNKIGYEIQQERIEALAAMTGDSIGAWYKDRDLTAADLKVARPDYERMLRDIAAGHVGGIAVWRLDRLVRLTREFERCWGVVQDAGGCIISAEPLISSRDDIGLVMMRLLVMFAEMEISAMKARSRAHQQAKREAGKYKGGGIRAYGFEGALREHVTGCADEQCLGCGPVLNPGRVGIAHVPAEVALIREAAQRRLAGELPTEILTDWAARGIRGSTGSLFNATTLMNMLTSARVAGKREYTVIDEEAQTEHTVFATAEWEAILTQDQWTRLRALRKMPTKRGPAHRYLLTGGLIVCGRCGMPLVASRTNAPRQRSVRGYRCDAQPAAKAAGACGALTVSAVPVERLVIAEALRRARATRPVLEAAHSRLSKGSRTQLDHALAEVDRCNTELEELAGERGRRQLTPGEHRAAREPVAARLAKAEAVVSAYRSSAEVLLPHGAEWDDLEAWFEHLTIAQQRNLVRLLVPLVTIKPAAARGWGAFDPSRVAIAPAGVSQ